MNHLSLFSGIGGFDLAAEWMGWNNVAQVEKDPYCLEVLKLRFPKTKKYEDIKDFTGSDYAGRIDIITGGFPCQPFSQAGSRKGRDDDRHLWPEMLRVIRTIKPTWLVIENVRGLLTIEQGLVFEQMCIDLDASGYEVQPVIIPAAGINAPHKRYRVWFVAYANRHANRRRSGKVRAQEKVQGVGGEALLPGMPSRVPADASGVKWWEDSWVKAAAELCRPVDGLPVRLGGLKLSRTGHKDAQIKAYGNAIVPQLAYRIFEQLIIN